MATHLANIFATEKDRVNCPFYFKIGACRHGDRCSRAHNRPAISETVLFRNMYQSLANGPPPPPGQAPPSRQEGQEHFEDFFEDVFEELAKHGEVASLHVCDNSADHLAGNVYATFREESDAEAALKALNGRFYAGRPIQGEFSPVTDFREATCRQFVDDTCSRGGNCNFMHLRRVSRSLERELFGRYRGRDRTRRGGHASRSPPPRRHRRSRSLSPSGSQSRSRSRSRSRDRHGRGRDRRHHHRHHHHDRGHGRGRGRGDRDRYGRDDGLSVEDQARRAKIAAWNRARQQKLAGEEPEAKRQM